MRLPAQRLFDAVQTNDLEFVRTAIAKRQAIFSHEDRHRNGVLHWAAHKGGRADMLRLILNADGRPAQELDRFNNSYKTPLMMAVGQGNLDQVQILLEAGADPNRQYEFMGKHKAALHDAISAAVVERLVQAGGRLEARDEGMFTPLLLMAWNGRVDVFDAMLRAGADLHATVTACPHPHQPRDLIGCNALHLAAMSAWVGSPAMVARLLDLGFSPLEALPSGTTALQLAREQALRGHTENLLIVENWVLRHDLGQGAKPTVAPSSRSRL